MRVTFFARGAGGHFHLPHPSRTPRTPRAIKKIVLVIREYFFQNGGSIGRASDSRKPVLCHAILSLVTAHMRVALAMRANLRAAAALRARRRGSRAPAARAAAPAGTTRPSRCPATSPAPFWSMSGHNEAGVAFFSPPAAPPSGRFLGACRTQKQRTIKKIVFVIRE